MIYLTAPNYSEKNTDYQTVSFSAFKTNQKYKIILQIQSNQIDILFETGK